MPALLQCVWRSALQQDQWHYERSGKRLGPVDRATIGELVEKQHIERATLVWNPEMADWAKAATTELVDLFGNAPPPLPASKIKRWAIYTLSLFPLWGLLVQAILSAQIAKQSGFSPSEVFDQIAWIAFYILGNGILGEIDEHYLRKGGLKLRGAAVLSGILVPIYILVSCITFKRHSGRSAFAAFLPLLMWFASLVGSALAYPLFFDTGAPIIFRPDTWF